MRHFSLYSFVAANRPRSDDLPTLPLSQRSTCTSFVIAVPTLDAHLTGTVSRLTFSEHDVSTGTRAQILTASHPLPAGPAEYLPKLAT